MPLRALGLSRAARVERCRETGSSNPSDGGSGSDGTGDLGHLVHHLEQVSKLIGGGIGADLNRIGTHSRNCLGGLGIFREINGRRSSKDLSTSRYPMVMPDHQWSLEMHKSILSQYGSGTTKIGSAARPANVLASFVICSHDLARI
jgi:hypothetical protein